jgi:hypothetical protein
MLVSIPIVVGNVSQLIALGYTKIEIFCSTDLGNSYSEITSASAQAASLTSTAASTTFRMGGKLLKIALDSGATLSISFSPLVQYWTPAQVASRINEVASGRASVSGSSVVLTSSTTGRTSNVSIVYNDASDLGWATGDSATGTDARISLVGGTFYYSYVDNAGQSLNKYKWRYSNGTTLNSDYSEPVNGDVSSLISAGSLSLATATFVDVQGVPVQRSIIVAPADGTPQSIGGMAVGDVSTKVFTSDANGFLAVSLVRGAKLRVAIEGTTLVRDITVPSVATFDLLTALTDVADAFTIQTTPPLLTRRNP